MNAVPSPLPDEGWPVPLRAAFTGLKGIPLLAFSYNNANPRLVLFDDHVEYKVLRAATRPIADIECVGVMQKWRTQNLVLAWRGERLTFVANVGRADLLRDVVAFFGRRGVPLTEAAQKLETTPL